MTEDTAGQGPGRKLSAHERNQADVARAFNKLMSDREATRLLRELDESTRAPVTAFSGAQLDAMVIPPLVLAIPGILPEGVAMLCGKPKSGKSWLAYGWALALAAGGSVLGCLNGQAPRPVLYHALEDSPRRLRERRDFLGYGHTPAGIDYVTQAAPDQIAAYTHAWLSAHEGQRPVVIVDTWGKVSAEARRGETTYDRDYRVGGYFKWMTEAHPGSTIAVVHHTRKAEAEDFLDTVSGTQGIAGSADTIIVLVRKRYEDQGILHVTGRDIDENRYALELAPCWALAGGSLEAAMAEAEGMDGADGQNMSARAQQLLARIRADGRITTAEAGQMLGITTDQASTYLGRLRKNGQIGKAERGIWVSDPSGRQADASDEGVGSVGKQPRTRVEFVGSVGSVVSPYNPTEQTGPYVHAYAREAEQAGAGSQADWLAWWQMSRRHMRYDDRNDYQRR